MSIFQHLLFCYTLSAVKFVEHPMRRDLVREMHLRRFAPVAAPSAILQCVLLLNDEEREAEFQRLAKIAEDHGFELLPEARHAFISQDDDYCFLWERHTEATTLTFISEGNFHTAFARGYRLLEGWPGRIVRATKILVEKDVGQAQSRLDEMQFEDSDLVSCEVNAGVKIWSDFRIREDGFGRLLIAAGRAKPAELGRILQRLQELGNYRNLALLGLPEVRHLTPALTELENRLARYSLKLGNKNDESDEQLLQDLSGLSAELARLRAESSYRLSASRAYAQITMDRLDALSIKPCEGYQDLADFTERRLVPGMRTCESFSERIRRLSERVGDAIALLNTRIDTRIKAQNLEVLRSMEKTFNLQLRLQRLVEGLSVIAASYYLVGLIAYVVKGAAEFPNWNSIEFLLAILTPVVIVSIFALLALMRRQYLGGTQTRSEKGE